MQLVGQISTEYFGMELLRRESVTVTKSRRQIGEYLSFNPRICRQDWIGRKCAKSVVVSL